ncbi:hypothetical protein [Flavobacterium suncheonense]|uniref:Uncharacterized protein n=1 Tax=Flavobacterium suncheonense GH29-5 = DSM 17707 TaxID=1121899 RepID=A0A0A2MBV3_9FLAO|nr:hypothetical protein [Flavobacterium suncheonense]KGO89729.1 hypothetical protein Q764_05910 [Flavobacterium suncheonense GH29-5 = DSM 17707]
MKFFKAIEQPQKPFITWHEWAKDIIELTEMGEYGNPLIVGEDYIPEYIYGVCPWKIEGGELVERTSGEMNAFEAEFEVETTLRENAAKISEINTGSFTYDSTDFPMDDVSRLFYTAIANEPPVGDVKCMTVDGTLYNLPNANIGAFITEYYKQLRVLAQPPV